MQTNPQDHLDVHGDTRIGPSVTQAIPQGLYQHQRLQVGLQESAPTTHQQHPNSPADHMTMTPQSLRPWSATKAEVQQLNDQISAAQNARSLHLEQISDQFSKYQQAFEENMKINQALMKQVISQIKTTNVSESTRLLTPTRETLVQDGTSLNLASSDIKVPQNPAPSQTPQEHPENRDQKDLEVIPTIKTEPLTIIRLKPNQAFGLSPRAYQKFKELRHKQARIVLKRLPLNKLLDKSPKRTSRPLRWLGPVVKKLCLPWPIESAKNKQSGNNRGPIRKKSNKIPAAAEDKLQWSTLSDGCTKYGSLCGIKHPAEVTRNPNRSHGQSCLAVIGQTLQTIEQSQLLNP